MKLGDPVCHDEEKLLILIQSSLIDVKEWDKHFTVYFNSHPGQLVEPKTTSFLERFLTLVVGQQFEVFTFELKNLVSLIQNSYSSATKKMLRPIKKIIEENDMDKPEKLKSTVIEFYKRMQNALRVEKSTAEY